MPRRVFAVLLALAGCASSYDPPVAGDRSDVKFQADLARCRTDASKAASRRANATPQSALKAMFDSGERERMDVVACMESRGHPAKPAAQGAPCPASPTGEPDVKATWGIRYP